MPRTRAHGLAALLAYLLAALLSGCGGVGSAIPAAGPTPATPSAAPTQSPVVNIPVMLTMMAERPPGSPRTPAPILPPTTGPTCSASSIPRTPVPAASGVPSPAAIRTPTTGTPQSFAGPCVDHAYAQPLVFSPDGQSLAVGGAIAVGLYDPASGAQRWVLSVPSRAAVLAFAPDDGTLAIGMADGRVMLCRAVDGVIARTLNRPDHLSNYPDETAAAALTFSPDGRLLASGYWGFAAVWALDDGGAPKTLGVRGPVVALAFEENGAYLRTGQNGGIRMSQHGDATFTSRAADPNIMRWRTSDWWLDDLRALPVIGALRLSADGSTLAAVTDTGITLWALTPTPPTPRLIPAQISTATSLPQIAFSPRGDLLVGGTYSGKVYLWEVRSLSVIASYIGPQKSINGVAVAPDNVTVAAVFSDGTVYLWQR